jgi:hypothetical protein
VGLSKYGMVKDPTRVQFENIYLPNIGKYVG